MLSPQVRVSAAPSCSVTRACAAVRAAQACAQAVARPGRLCPGRTVSWAVVSGAFMSAAPYQPGQRVQVRSVPEMCSSSYWR